MFDLPAMLLSSVASFLFPIFASYKALKTADPAQLTPWLMYWVVLSCFLLAESWVYFIVSWCVCFSDPLRTYARASPPFAKSSNLSPGSHSTAMCACSSSYT
jgi:hypothetical protein